MKRSFYLYTILPVVLLICTCKKQSGHLPVSYDVTGTWTLAAFKSTYIDTVDVTVAQYPCMSASVKTFFANGTVITRFAGNVDCYVTPRGSKGIYLGNTGAPADTAVWKLKGNVLYLKSLKSVKPEYGTLSAVNGKLQLTVRDTLVFAPNIYYDTFVDVKQ